MHKKGTSSIIDLRPSTMHKSTNGGSHMNYTQCDNEGQLKFLFSTSFLNIPSFLDGFTNTETTHETTKSMRDVFCFHGTLDISESDRICECCGYKTHINNGNMITLRHLCFGSTLTHVTFKRKQFLCNKCKHTKMQEIQFKADNHRITTELHQYTRELLALSTYTLKQVAEITGLGKNTVKDIDLVRLKELYMIDGKNLIKPEKTAKYLGIDEFKLHDGHKYATHIIDMETGHILWISHGKKKQVVYDFIDHVTLEWMDSVEAIACDMNSDFQEAFEDRCPHIQMVFDYFHIVKNFNDKVVSKVRIDEQNRLRDEGDFEASTALKKTKYILTSSRKTLQRKDQEAKESKVISKGSTLFCKTAIVRKEGYEEKYNQLLKDNKLLFTLDVIKEKLTKAYSETSEAQMASELEEIMDICKATGNPHLLWFRRLIDSHFEGMIAHATYKISAGKIEGINNKIKTIRRQGYGYPDDDYFFLKLFDMSRKGYVRNAPSHKICD